MWTDNDNMRCAVEAMVFIIIFGVAVTLIYLSLNCPSPTALHC